MNANFVLLYVDSPTASAAFYTKLLGRPPVEASPTFAMFALSSGVMLGLWAKETVSPQLKPGQAPGASELAFTVESQAQVDATHSAWQGNGLTIAQPPTTLDFGHTFVALDPDGHRLRVFAPNA